MSKFKILNDRVKKDMPFKETGKIKVEKKGSRPVYTDRVRKVFYPVWVLGTSNKPTRAKEEQFEWPEFKKESERIKAFSRRYRNTPIEDAFGQVYGVEVNFDENTKMRINSTPSDLRVGDIVEMTISSCDKDNIIFDCMNLKQMISSNTNLYRYANFKKFTPNGPIRVKVITSTPQKIVVDPLAPMLDEWLDPIIADNDLQKLMGQAKTIKIKNLRLTRGGFVGQAIIPNISNYVGEDYTIEAFIPGSQIVLNVENDFSKWEGKTVDAFVTSYIPKPNASNQMSLICSVKEYLKFEGDQKLIEIFNHWCDDDKEWAEVANSTYRGVVTGVIQSSKKCGAFVEIPELNITGFVTLKADQLGNYPPNKNVSVKFVGIEEPTYYDDATAQLKHDTPYVVEDGILRECNIKPVLEFV